MERGTVTVNGSELKYQTTLKEIPGRCFFEYIKKDSKGKVESRELCYMDESRSTFVNLISGKSYKTSRYDVDVAVVNVKIDYEQKA